jgi:hypothetical protein
MTTGSIAFGVSLALLLVVPRVAQSESFVPTTLLYETFRDGQIPSNWTIHTYFGTEDYPWVFDNPGNRTNVTGGTGGFAIVDSLFYQVYMCTTLDSPTLDLSHETRVYLSFNSDAYGEFHHYSAVVVSTNNDYSLNDNIWTDSGHLRGPTNVLIDLSAYAGLTGIVVHFVYETEHPSWWEIDDVLVRGSSIDTDDDGLPDWWEERYFEGPTNGVAGEDFDNDLVCNINEWLADTDPTNSASYSILSTIVVVSSNMNDLAITIGPYTSPLRRYALCYTTNILSMDEAPVSTSAQGSPDHSPVLLIDTNTANEAFFRVIIEEP